MQQSPLTTPSYDISGHSIWRALKQEGIFRLLPFGSFGGGPNLFYMARLLSLHLAGRLWFWLAVRMERLAPWLIRWRRQVKR